MKKTASAIALILYLALMSVVTFHDTEEPSSSDNVVASQSNGSSFENIDLPSYSSNESYTVYPVSMTMQAGYQEYNPYANGLQTIHSGIGYMDPFGEGYYYAGIGYAESAYAPLESYISSWMLANYSCSLFCIYHTPVGDIYAWDGIYGANSVDSSNSGSYSSAEVIGQTPTRSDALINIVVGGTGKFKGAYGVLIGSTSGGGQYGVQGGMLLPQALFKLMDGYIVVPDNCENPSLYDVTENISADYATLEARDSKYAMVDVTLRLQTGSLEAYTNGENTGIGTFLPFNANAITVDFDNASDKAAMYNVSDYVNQNWLSAYDTPTFTVIHVDDGTVHGDLYGYKFNYGKILDTSSDLSETGSQEAVFLLIIDGTDDFSGITGILGGHDAISDLDGWGIEVEGTDLPNTCLTLLDGYLKVPAESLIVSSGIYANDVIE